MTTHLGLQRILLPTAQVSSLTTGSITLPSARGTFVLPTSFDSIASATPSGVNSVTFSSIPSTYKHLELRVAIKSPSGSPSLAVRFNSDSGSNYTVHQLRGNSESISSGNSTDRTSFPLAWTNGMTIFGKNVAIVDIFDYASTAKLKSVRSFYGQRNTSSGHTELSANLYTSTSAITSITISISGDLLYESGSTLSLYGIAS